MSLSSTPPCSCALTLVSSRISLMHPIIFFGGATSNSLLTKLIRYRLQEGREFHPAVREKGPPEEMFWAQPKVGTVNFALTRSIRCVCACGTDVRFRLFSHSLSFWFLCVAAVAYPLHQHAYHDLYLIVHWYHQPCASPSMSEGNHGWPWVFFLRATTLHSSA